MINIVKEQSIDPVVKTVFISDEGEVKLVSVENITNASNRKYNPIEHREIITKVYGTYHMNSIYNDLKNETSRNKTSFIAIKEDGTISIFKNKSGNLASSID